MVTPATRPGSFIIQGQEKGLAGSLFLLSDFAVREFGVAEPSDQPR